MRERKWGHSELYNCEINSGGVLCEFKTLWEPQKGHYYFLGRIGNSEKMITHGRRKLTHSAEGIKGILRNLVELNRPDLRSYEMRLFGKSISTHPMHQGSRLRDHWPHSRSFQCAVQNEPKSWLYRIEKTNPPICFDVKCSLLCSLKDSRIFLISRIATVEPITRCPAVVQRSNRKNKPSCQFGRWR